MSVRHSYQLLKSDYRRYRAIGGKHNQGSLIGIVLFSQGFWASCVYRLGKGCLQSNNLAIFRPLFRITLPFLKLWIEIVTGISIPYTSEIGQGLYIGHFGTIIVHPRATLGSNCNLSQGVTIGMVQNGQRKGIPTIGDRVYLGPNSIVIGNIDIGNDVAVGAGSVVINSAPDRAVVAGNPAKIISNNGSFELIRFDDMDLCPDRQKSLQAVRN